MTAPRACVIGHPIGHSRSPLIHGYWLERYRLDGGYDRRDIPPEALGQTLARLREDGYVGANITVPHKEAAFRAVVSASRTARRLQVVNTLYFEDDMLCGDSTDGEGFVASLDASAPGWAEPAGPVAVLGAGGAARAIVGALADAGVTRFRLVNRDIARARALAQDLCPQAQTCPWPAVADALDGASLLVNTTSLGMDGQPPLDLDLSPLAPAAVVADIVYAPLETGLLRTAAGAGHRTVDGLGMLLHQAVPGFARWFGVTPEVTGELRALVERDLAHTP